MRRLREAKHRGIAIGKPRQGGDRARRKLHAKNTVKWRANRDTGHDLDRRHMRDYRQLLTRILLNQTPPAAINPELDFVK